jgi:spore maturation protein CgeB
MANRIPPLRQPVSRPPLRTDQMPMRPVSTSPVMAPLRIAFFGSSLVSAYWNGAATYYRGLIRAMHQRGHQVTFFEPDAFHRQEHRDIDDPDWARVVVYPAQSLDDVHRALEQARDADIIVKASGVGVFDAELERDVLSLRKASNQVIFWDVDAPATLERLRQTPDDPFHALVPQYDLVLTYGGGPPVVNEYTAIGARACVPIYNAVDPDTHHPVAPEPRFEALCGFLGNRLPDREARVHEFFLDVARGMPDDRFLLGGSGWDDMRETPPNVRCLGHVYTRDHNAFNCTPRAVLNINRDSMAATGWSPPTRVFEAAGAGACLIVDAWAGIEDFLEPDSEVLVASSGAEVASHLRALTATRAREIGERALARVCAEHTYAHRAARVEAVLTSGANAEVGA